MTQHTCFLSSAHSHAWLPNLELSVVMESVVVMSLGVIVSGVGRLSVLVHKTLPHAIYCPFYFPFHWMDGEAHDAGRERAESRDGRGLGS